MPTKKSKIEWIAETFNEKLDRAIELSDQIQQKYDIEQDLPHEPLTQEYWDMTDKILDLIRDEFYCTEAIAKNLFFATLRLRRRGKA